MNTLCGTYISAIELGNAFFPIPDSEDHQKQLAFSMQCQKYSLTLLPQGLSTFQPYAII